MLGELENYVISLIRCVTSNENTKSCFRSRTQFSKYIFTRLSMALCVHGLVVIAVASECQ